MGKTIRKLREKRNYTQEAVAKDAKMCEANYRNIESNKTNINIGMLAKIVNVLKLKCTIRFEGDDFEPLTIEIPPPRKVRCFLAIIYQ